MPIVHFVGATVRYFLHYFDDGNLAKSTARVGDAGRGDETDALCAVALLVSNGATEAGSRQPYSDHVCATVYGHVNDGQLLCVSDMQIYVRLE